MNAKKITPKHDAEQKTRVILENIRSDISTVAEGHGIIIKRLDNVELELTFIKAAVMEVDSNVKEVDARLEKVEHKLDNVEHKLDTVTNAYGVRITSLEAKIS